MNSHIYRKMASLSNKKAILIFFYFSIHYLYCHNVEFTNDNWKEMLEGEWLVKFFAPWCPACRALEDTWNELATWGYQSSHVSVGSVNVVDQAALNGRFMITSLPTIYHVKDGLFRQYKSGRSLSDIQKFINDEEWKEISPGSSWSSPTSSLMGGISKLFSLSIDLKNFHESLRNEYGLPGWLSFVLFGLAVIVVGLLLGIILVLVSDWVWAAPTTHYAEHKKNDDIVGDDDDDDKKAGENIEQKKQESKNTDKKKEGEEAVRQRKVKNSDED